jgi:hypothetical protein
LAARAVVVDGDAQAQKEFKEDLLTEVLKEGQFFKEGKVLISLDQEKWKQ